VLLLSGGSAWGMWLGFWMAQAMAEPEDGLFELGVGTTAVMTDVALLVTSIGISRLVDLPPARFGWISLAGGFGMATGLLTANLTGSSYKQGMAWGIGGGLVAGTVLTQFGDFPDPPVEYDARAPSPDGGGTSGLVPEIEALLPSMQVTPLSAEMPREEGERYLMTLIAIYR
jgi:hypothetical protein